MLLIKCQSGLLPAVLLHTSLRVCTDTAEYQITCIYWLWNVQVQVKYVLILQYTWYVIIKYTDTVTYKCICASLHCSTEVHMYSMTLKCISSNSCTITAVYRVFIVQAYLTSQYVAPRSDIFLGKWRSSFAGCSDGKMNVQSACALNTRYNPMSQSWLQLRQLIWQVLKWSLIQIHPCLSPSALAPYIPSLCLLRLG
jgi:hypothetical protein